MNEYLNIGFLSKNHQECIIPSSNCCKTIYYLMDSLIIHQQENISRYITNIHHITNIKQLIE